MRLIRKNDLVGVVTGKDKGKKGKVLKVFPRKAALLVEGVNTARKHRRRRSVQDQQAGIVSVERPVHISNVQYLCSRCNRPVRLGVKKAPDGSAVRFCRRCGEDV